MKEIQHVIMEKHEFNIRDESILVTLSRVSRLSGFHVKNLKTDVFIEAFCENWKFWVKNLMEEESSL